MKISEYIAELKILLEEHGDLSIQTTGYDDERLFARAPRVAFEKILAGREIKPKFAQTIEEAGNTVIRI